MKIDAGATTRLRYRAIARSDGGEVLTYFPDVPGIVGRATTMFESVDRAEATLKRHLLHLIKEDKPLPLPGQPAVDDGRDRRDRKSVSFLVSVDVPVTVERVAFDADQRLLSRIAALGQSPAAFFRKAAEQLLDQIDADSAAGAMAERAAFMLSQPVEAAATDLMVAEQPLARCNIH